MGQYNDVLYGVEPYTGKIICHTGQKGMKWGFTELGKKLVDSGKQAIGQLTSNGQYIYDRARSGQLGSRTMNNARNAATNVANRVGGVASRVRTAASNAFDTAKTGVAETMMNKSKNWKIKKAGSKLYKTTKKYKQEVKDAQNRKAKEARTRAAEARGNRYIYENRTLAGNIEREGRKIRSAVGNAKNALSRVGKSIVSAPGKAVNKVNNASSSATSRYQNFANNVNKGIQDWWDTKITGKKYKK